MCLYELQFCMIVQKNTLNFLEVANPIPAKSRGLIAKKNKEV